MLNQNPHWFREQMQGTESLPEEDVTVEEFIQLMIQAGETERDARMQAKVAKVLGSRVCIGNKMLGIKP